MYNIKYRLTKLKFETCKSYKTQEMSNVRLNMTIKTYIIMYVHVNICCTKNLTLNKNYIRLLFVCFFGKLYFV